MIVGDYENRLNDEGLTGGYRPIDGYNLSLAECLASRISNIYAVKYGGIETLCAGGVVATPKGHLIEIKAYPRSATGPDLRKAVIGSRNLLGTFREVTLRVFPLPEIQVWGVALFDSKEAARVSLRKIVGLFIRPEFIRIMEEEESEGLLRSLNLPDIDKVVFTFKLAGYKGIVEAEREAIIRSHDGEHVLFYWPSKMTEVEVLDQTIVTPEAFESMMDEFSPLIGSSLKPQKPKAEKDFEKFFEKNPC